MSGPSGAFTCTSMLLPANWSGQATTAQKVMTRGTSGNSTLSYSTQSPRLMKARWSNPSRGPWRASQVRAVITSNSLRGGAGGAGAAAGAAADTSGPPPVGGAAGERKGAVVVTARTDA